MRFLRACPLAAGACVLLFVLTSCREVDGQKTVAFDPGMDVFAPPSEGTGTASRTFQCTSKNADGTCNVNECKQGPGGATYDCASFAAACVDAGHHWSGTKEGGKCTRVL